MRIVVDGFGKYVGREGNPVVVKEKGRAVKKAKPSELKQLLISGRGAISMDAIELLLSHGVDVVFIDRLGRVRGRLMHPFVGTARTRREQYAAYNDRRGVVFAKEFASAKLRNQILVLTNLAKARKDSQPEVSERLIQARGEVKAALEALASISGERIEEVREEIMGIEGRASNAYWAALAMIFPREFGFEGRRGLEAGQTKYARDMINAMLNCTVTADMS